MDPFTWLFALGLLTASYVITASMAPKPTTPKPAAFEDFDFPQFEEGTPQAVIFGDVWTPDWIVLWYGNMRTSAIKEGGGGK